MSKTTSIILRVVGVILLVAIAAGVAFQFGYRLGVSNSPAIAEQMGKWLDKTGELPAPYAYRGMANPMPGYGYYAPFMAYGMGFHPIGRLVGILFTVFLVFGALRLIFFRPWMHHSWHHHMHPCMRYWDEHPENPPASGQPTAPQGESN